LPPKEDWNRSIQGEPDRWVHSACLVCSNGCGLDIAVKEEKIVGARDGAAIRHTTYQQGSCQ